MKMDLRQTIFASILNPRADGTVDFLRNGAISCDNDGIIQFVGDANQLPPPLASSRTKTIAGLIIPPMLDAHTHIPQHPIRGHFMDGIGENPPEGRLLAGLNRNVFPAEARCANPAFAEMVVRAFAYETLAQGVVGGAAYMTIHPRATEIAFKTLSDFWQLGLVLMEMNCPEELRVDARNVEDELRNLAGRFGKRHIITDRFAVAVGSDLRRMAVRVATAFDLRMQTHLNEQVREKELVEKQLYRDAASYTDVYRRDGLLKRRPILAHCIHMRSDEWDLVHDSDSVVAHCPTSNTLLCSGIMPLDEIKSRDIPYVICTDVGASPTTSLLAEMAQFLKVHAGRSKHATPQEALYRTTLAPTQILELSDRLGRFEIGKPMSFVEIDCDGRYESADDAILRGLLELDLSPYMSGEYKAALDDLANVRLDVGPRLDLLKRDTLATADRLEKKVVAVTLAGREVWRRAAGKTV